MPGFATRAIRAAGRTPDAPQPPVNVPIYQTSTFEVSSAQELADLLEFKTAGHSYSRYSNPTFAALEAALAELEGGEAAVVSGSGMAAIHAALASTLRPGDEVLAHRALYGGTYAILTGLFARFGVSARFLPLTDASAVAGAMTDRTRLIWAETIANPTTEMADLAALADLAHERKALLM
ncbi:MAG: aminotransferase class I/II-fold pyridoxal phosphate-dependent enzyme, partial [Chloroflexi bacterium]